MLDLGSTCSLLDASFARKIGVTGEPRKLDLSGIRERSLITSCRSVVQVSPGHQSAEIHKVENVWVVDKLNLPQIGVDMSQEKLRWTHLQDLDLPSVKGKKIAL